MSDSDPSLAPPDMQYTDPRDAVADMKLNSLARDLKAMRKSSDWIRNLLAGMVLAILIAAMAVGSYKERVDTMVTDVRALGARVGNLEAEVRRSR